MTTDRWRHLLAVMFAALLTTAAVVGCGGGGSSSGDGGADAVIGVAVPTSGPEATLGVPIANAVKLAVKEAGSGLPGSLSAKVEDDQEKPEIGATIARKFCGEDDIIGVVGHLASSVTVGAQPVYNGCELTEITPASSVDELTEKGYKNFFRTTPDNSAQGKGGAHYLAKNFPSDTTAVTIDANEATTVGLANVFVEAFEEEGGEVLSQEHITSGSTDFHGVLTKVIGENPSILYLALFYGDSSLVVKQARELGYKGEIMSVDSSITPEFVKIAGAASEGVLFTGLGLDPTKAASAQKFTKAFEAAYGEPPNSYAANAYDAARVLIGAWKKVGSVDREAITSAVAESHTEGTQGPISFTDTGDLADPQIGVFEVKGGEIVYVEPAG